MRRRGDVRFLLPHLPSAVALAGPDNGWREGLERGGIRVVGRHEPHDTLIVTGGASGWLPTGPAEQVLVEGRPRTPAGWSATSWGIAVHRREPIACARTDDRALIRHALDRWVPSSGRNRALHAAADRALAWRLPVPLPRVTVLERGGTGDPGLLSLATELGAPEAARPLFVIGGGTLDRRVAVMLYGAGATRPTCVLKTQRLPIPTLHSPEVEQALMRLITATGCTTVQVPALLGIGSWNGLPATLEQAMDGEALDVLLQRDPQRALQTHVVVARWLTDIAAATAHAAPSGAWHRAAAQLAESWPGSGALAYAAAERLDAVQTPLVVEHGDMADSLNVLAGARPAVIDWELGNPEGKPMSDVLPFMAHGLAVAGGTPLTNAEAEAEALLRLCRGEAPGSAQLGAVVRDHVQRLGLPSEATGPLALMAWLHHGAQRHRHRARMSEAGLSTEGTNSTAHFVADRWLSDPALGLDWPALAHC